MTRPANPERVVGRLLSLNVGGPRDIDWEGTTIRTAIWKEAVKGPRMARKINIDGDDQADRVGHGGEHRAIFVYQIEAYRYWEKQLKRDDFVHGQFGENFTVQGLADNEVRIGDHYRIGQALFEVTQPRVTCFRLAIRMNEPAMPSLAVAHHRPGFYFRVLEEGLVQAGDQITLVEVGLQHLTVADIDGLLYLPNRSIGKLKRAVEIPALSEGWRQSFRALLEQGDTPGSPKPGWVGFRPLVVTTLTRESSNVLSVHFKAPDGAEPLTVPEPGQYLTVKLPVNGPDQPPLIRSYSLSASDIDDGYRISVKHEPNGIGSGYIHEHLVISDTIQTAAPRGTFLLRQDERPVVFVSAGVGITPVLAMLESLAAASSNRQVWWIHGARNSQQHPFMREVDELIGELSAARKAVLYSDPLPNDVCDAVGRIAADRLFGGDIPHDSEYYLCGPEGFMHDLSAGLVSRGVPPERVRTEAFQQGAPITPGKLADRKPPHQPTEPPGTGVAVTFSRSNLTVAWDDSYPNLLEFAEACDVPASYGCRHGVCHYCETGVLGGEYAYSTEPLERPTPDKVLLCCAKPTSEMTLEI
ncbi:MAG TPA: MOSC and FAD-binding oxidoreductase domain-containing protein [Solirubrobacteraceae bacterium]|jgi:ferredoxin-NADP reductase/MOSC domain-containing protein YiiM|nr:MOSC and FAD-binding oxidoreductase domain-containing protein [Solirubrobacteraceae bacterium]